ncbi:MAG: amidase, partial [Bradyrhizobiaceae bacterium]
KTNTPEFGFGAVCTNRLRGPTRNPFNLALTSGGSSGGSAVAVAAGMVPLAHGTDFGGSVRTPASFCDVASIRPTPGRIPSPRRPLGWDMLATHGFLARGVEDLELALSVCAGGDANDPLSLGSVSDDRAIAGRPRIAVTPDFGLAPLARDVRARFSRTWEALARVADVVPSSPDCGGAIETFRTLRAAHIANAYGELLRTRRAELTPTVIWNIEAGANLSAEDYLNAERRRTAIYRSFRELFTRVDFLVAPAASVFPWPNEISDVTAIDGAALETPIDYLAVTFIVSLVGFPVLTIPVRRAVNELPFGVQVIAPPGCEARLFAFGRILENELGFSHRRPPL